MGSKWINAEGTAVFSYWQLGSDTAWTDDLFCKLEIRARAFQGASKSANAVSLGYLTATFVVGEGGVERSMVVLPNGLDVEIELTVRLPESEFVKLAQTLAASGDGRDWLMVNYQSERDIVDLVAEDWSAIEPIPVIALSINKSRKPV